MRTTVTLDSDVAAFLEQSMRERDLTFKQAINEAVRAGMRRRQGLTRQALPTYDMGEPLIDLTKALRVAAELEDQEMVSRLSRGA